MRNLAFSVLILLAASSAFGHAGEVHKYMGTISVLHEDGSFLLKTTDGKTVDVQIAATTAWQQADGHAATRAELAAGKRVVVTMAKDGKTATLVKFAAGKR